VSVFNDPDPEPLPVNVWFYGGAYAFGTKHVSTEVFGIDVDLPLYSGRSLMKSSKYETIFVAGNYRLGAFGWLAGSHMEKDGLPNAGLHDQRLLLEFVQEWISKVHGDKRRVSAWGESAGAGSILHHLIRDDGNKDPLFSRFVAQSPAFEWSWNNTAGGEPDKMFQAFAKGVNCTGSDQIECLRDTKALSTEALAKQNIELYADYHKTGLFPLGPAIDKKWVKTIPTLAFSQGIYRAIILCTSSDSFIGKYWKKIDSAIVAHCANDAEKFTPKSVTDKDSFMGFLMAFLPGQKLEPLRKQIADHYDCEGNYGGDYHLCLRYVIRDSSFGCNTRDLIDAFSEKTYAMNYAYPTDDLAFHGSDLIPLFMNNDVQTRPMLNGVGMSSILDRVKWAPAIDSQVQPKFLSYFSSFAVNGSLEGTDWPIVSTGENKLSNVMKVNATNPWPWKTKVFWMLVEDEQNSQDVCSFWHKIAENIMEKMKEGSEEEVNVDGDGNAQEEVLEEDMGQDEL
jgi:carboxylesterase type B